MVKRALVFAGVAVLAVGGWVAADRWRDRQEAACQSRGDQLATLDLLNQRPPGFQGEKTYAGCDLERIIAYAGRQFVATNGPGTDALAGQVAGQVDESAVSAFYRTLLDQDAWRITPSNAALGPDKPALCATKELSSGEARISLSFPLAGMYELAVADPGDSASRCG